jgi:hypothetical protein
MQQSFRNDIVMLRNHFQRVLLSGKAHRSVWHAGFLHAREAEELSRTIAQKRQEISRLTQTFSSVVRLVELEDEINTLKQQYLSLCGEEWEEGDGSLERANEKPEPALSSL